MIRSMTGYGKSTLSKQTRQYQVEIKSVNHRYLDISIKMPRVLSYLEEDIKKEIAKNISRGKIEVFVVFEDSDVDTKNIKLNKQLAKVYIQELRELAKQENISSNIEAIEITKLPDVLKIENPVEDEKIKEELIETVITATKGLLEMKQKEGNKIAQDLMRKN